MAASRRDATVSHVSPAVITIGLDPEFRLGPLTLSWHGLTIAAGILAGGLLAGRWLRRQGLSADPMYTIIALAAVGGVVGSRLFYVVEHGGPLLGMHGFTFFGGLILAALLIAAYVWRARLDARYLHAAALGLPLGYAIGRIGDVINGEHYGAASNWLLAVRNSNPDASTPDPTVAYQNGALYEVLLGLVIFAVVWPLRDRVRRPGELALLVIALFAVGRFSILFIRVDSPSVLGLANAQWTSLGLLAVATAWWWVLRRRSSHGRPRRRSRPTPAPRTQ